MSIAAFDELSRRVGTALQNAGTTLVLAESCTGGGIAEVITRTAGSSAWFSCGFVCYSNQSKIRMLGVNAETLRDQGAVSEATAAEMALGALARSNAGIAISVTGIAGPDGGTVEKPVGTVCFALCHKGQSPRTSMQRFIGDRDAVRQQSIEFALKTLLEIL